MKKNEFEFYRKALKKHERTWVEINGKEYKYCDIHQTSIETNLSGTFYNIKTHAILVDREDTPHQLPVKIVADAFGEFLPPMTSAILR